MAVPWELLISTVGGVTATIVGVVAGGVVGRRSENRKWLQETQTSAYERFLQAFGAVEMELREAFLERRRPAVAWGPFNASIQSLSLVANPRRPQQLSSSAMSSRISPSSSTIVSQRILRSSDRSTPPWTRGT